MADIKVITDQDELDKLFEASHNEPVFIFKHSSTCGISLHVFEQVSEINGTINVVVVQDSRPLSDNIAERTGQRHQSPQAFVIRDGGVDYHATHYAIDANAIQQKLAVK